MRGLGDLALGVILSCLMACGGNVEGGGSEETTQRGGSGSTDPDSASESNETDGLELDYSDLGECELGALATDIDQPCRWLADGRCYEKREMACNCICPRASKSVCTSGFAGGPRDRVRIVCG